MRKKIKITKKILNTNNYIASKLRTKFQEKNIFTVNIMSSPGSGKTTILEKTLPIISKTFKCTVIVGDICTNKDAERISKSNVKVIQINTDKFGGDCHLTASSIEKTLTQINLDNVEILIIENIGNLVCPAEFDVGENKKIVIFSTTEGEDKPLKYPLMFREADIILLNKIDLIPYLQFNKKEALNILKSINPTAPILEVSAMKEQGLDLWIEWIKKNIKITNLPSKKG